MRIGSKGTKKLIQPSNLPSVLIPEALELYDFIVDKNRIVRKLGYDLSDLKDESTVQMDFFTNTKKAEKEKRLVHTVLDIKNKFGKNAILRGIDFDMRATQRERNEQIGGHKSGKD